MRTAIERFRWEREVEVDDAESTDNYHNALRKKLCAPFLARLHFRSMAEVFGGGESGEKIAAFILEIQHNLNPGELGRPFASTSESSPVQSNQAESSQIKPNQAS